MATIPVGSYEGGGRGKERERDKDKEREREREKEREREAAANSHFAFDLEPPGQTASPSAHPTEEPASSLEGSSAGDSSDSRNRESTTAKEVREHHILALTSNTTRIKY